jgi:PUA domain protein
MQVEADTAVAIYEGKEHAMAIGLTKMSTKEMREVGEVIGMEQGMG